jgi:hypothetical protein
MRNIKHIVLWGLPPSFCVLVQRAGCAAHDFRVLGEAIVIVTLSIIAKDITEMEVESALANTAEDRITEAENRGEDEVETLARHGIQLAGGNEMVHVDDGGVRVTHNSDKDVEERQKKRSRKERKRRRKISTHGKPVSSHYLS